MQHSAMTTQLSLLLLLMLGSVASNDIFGVYLNKMCGNTPSSAELHAPECPERSEPPCRTTNRTETLALPLLLSLNTGSSTGHPELQRTTMQVLGVAWYWGTTQETKWH